MLAKFIGATCHIMRKQAMMVKAKTLYPIIVGISG